MRHIINAESLSNADLETIFTYTRKLKKEGVKPETQLGLLNGRPRILASIFYEESTRTRLSFEAAMLRIGGEVIGTENARQFSSVLKGETLEDMIRVIAEYADIIVLRHDGEGAAENAASVSRVPVINAGDGSGEHPTQAFLDLFTILDAFPKQDGLRITFVGDLKYGRTVHSLARLLIRPSSTPLVSVSHINFVSPPAFQIPSEYLDMAMGQEISTSVCEEFTPEVTRRSDVIYTTRPQIKRHNGEEKRISNGSLAEQYKLTPELLGHAPEATIVMHPLPRTEELPVEIDADPRARYFEQAANGLYVRKALLLWVSEKI